MQIGNALEDQFYTFLYKHTRNTSSLPVEYFHLHRGIEVLYVYEGSGHVILDDRSYTVGPRTLLIYKPFQLHYFHMNNTSKYTCTVFKVKPNFLDQCEHFLPQCHNMIANFLNDKESEQIFQL